MVPGQAPNEPEEIDISEGSFLGSAGRHRRTYRFSPINPSQRLSLFITICPMNAFVPESTAEQSQLSPPLHISWSYIDRSTKVLR